ncbi:DUF4446 family protein [Paenibacillus sp. IB182496]|uniref:DUF4446 family protein n=1 Tax=Paenibacillus sabuli TaxID=2772509 RepID=A0A927GUS4_9BACL|nr:DUF4446 family protein [Paenibacillus sabuli]MBD2848012.1 DUF4446 family protein [Paenibacillus sabuli]
MEAMRNSEWMAAAILGAGVLLLMLWLIVLSVKLRKMRLTYDRWVSGAQVSNLEDVIQTFHSSLRRQEEHLQVHTEKLKALSEAMAIAHGHVGVVRYNAFAEQGSDMSFSLAIVNERRDGIVITGLHSRQETYVYAKPLKEGASMYALSTEEQQAITQALQQA